MKQETMRSVAWLLKGLTGSTPGVMTLAQGKLSFYTEEGCVWDVALSEIKAVEFPWYYFDGGLKLQIGAQWHSVSFVRPNDADHITDRAIIEMVGGLAGGAIAALTVGQKVRDIGTGRQAGKAWREVLTATKELTNASRSGP
jgi:hypothetical protein